MWPNPYETADLLTFSEENLNGKLHFLCCIGSLHCLLLTNASMNIKLTKHCEKCRLSKCINQSKETSKEKFHVNMNLKIKSTALSAIISPNFLVWKFCGKARFPQNFRRISRICCTSQQDVFDTFRWKVISWYWILNILISRSWYH